MIKYEDECCGCAVPAYPCLGSSCPNRNVPHYYCDTCGEEVGEFYVVDDSTDEYICEDCLKQMYEFRSIF